MSDTTEKGRLFFTIHKLIIINYNLREMFQTDKTAMMSYFGGQVKKHRKPSHSIFIQYIQNAAVVTKPQETVTNALQIPRTMYLFQSAMYQRFM